MDGVVLKTCRGCLREGIADLVFYKASSGGFRPRCKECHSAQTKSWVKRNPDKHKTIYRRANHRSNLRGRFGISVEEYERLEAKYGTLCSICKQPETRQRRICLDHDHKTMMLRGFLCSRCNMVIGRMVDDPELLAAAESYLRRPPMSGEHVPPQNID